MSGSKASAKKPSESKPGPLDFLYPAILSGFLAAISSVFGKIASDESSYIMRLAICSPFFGLGVCTSNRVSEAIENTDLYALYVRVMWVCRAIAFGGYILTTGIMWSQFTRAMNMTTTVKATIVNAGTNFFCSVCQIGFALTTFYH
jgi:hypothetical protein